MKRVRIALLIISFTAIVLVYAVTRPLVDFSVYWTAAHLFISGHDSYSLPAVFDIQKSLGWTGPIPIMFLSPPWMLPLLAPLGVSNSYVLSWLTWFALSLAAVAWASKMLMDLYFGEIDIPEISSPGVYRYLFGFTFYPVLLSLKMSQLGPFLLLGIVGFVCYERKGRYLTAGMFLALTFCKPHLFLFVWLAILFTRRWRALSAAAAFVAALTLVAIMRDHRIFQEYWQLMSGPFPKVVYSGMLAGIRKSFEARDTYWLQGLPPIAGLAWFSWYWRKHRESWDWKDQLPAMATGSLIFAPYGFIHDQPLLIVPIIALAASCAKCCGFLPFKIVALYTAVNVASLAVAIYSTPWCVIPAPVAIALCLSCWPRLMSDTPRMPASLPAASVL